MTWLRMTMESSLILQGISTIKQPTPTKCLSLWEGERASLPNLAPQERRPPMAKWVINVLCNALNGYLLSYIFFLSIVKAQVSVDFTNGGKEELINMPFSRFAKKVKHKQHAEILFR